MDFRVSPPPYGGGETHNISIIPDNIICICYVRDFLIRAKTVVNNNISLAKSSGM